MSNFNSENSNLPGKSVGIGSTIGLIFFGIPFAAFGVFAMIQGVRKISTGNKDGPMLCIFGFIFSLAGFGLMFGAIFARKKSKQKAELEARFADKPWMMRQDWAEGKIKASTMGQPKMFLIMGIAFCGIGGFSTCMALPEVWQKHNYAALVVLLFPLIGIGLLIAFVAAWRSNRRFGECFFELAEIPIPLGGVLEGMIQTGAPLRLEHELHLKFSCVRRVHVNKNVNEYALWQSEKIYSEQASLPDSETGTGIPVHFRLPADQPECYSRGNESVFWRLEAKTKLSGPDFHAVFEVPVYKIADAAIAQSNEADDSDPTAALAAPIEEIRREVNSKIKISDGPNGREFYFPPARNVGTAIFMMLATFLFGGIAVGTYYLHALIIFPMVFGAVGVLMVFGTFSMWFKSSRVTIDSMTVCATTRWLFFHRTFRFPTDGVARFATKSGMQSGSTVFTDIKLILRGSDEKFAAEEENSKESQSVNQLMMRQFREAAGPRGVTVASSIGNIAEANWLVAELNKALGRLK